MPIAWFLWCGVWVCVRRAVVELQWCQSSHDGDWCESKAYPLANVHFTKKLLDLAQQSCNYEQLQKGASETTKTLDRDSSEFIVTSADAVPLESILHFPLLCEDKSSLRICALQAGFSMGLWSVQGCHQLFGNHQRRVSTKTADPAHSAVYWKALGVGYDLCPFLTTPALFVCCIVWWDILFSASFYYIYTTSGFCIFCLIFVLTGLCFTISSFSSTNFFHLPLKR